MEGFVHEDESPPDMDIDICHKQCVTTQSSFAAYKPYDLHRLYQELVGSYLNADNFFDMHMEVLRDLETAQRSVVSDVVMQVNAKTVTTDEDGGDEQYMDLLHRAVDAPTYRTQQSRLNKAMVPFVVDAKDEQDSCMVLEQTDAAIHLSDGSPSVYLKEDATPVPVTAATWIAHIRRSCKDYLFDAGCKTLDTPTVDATTMPDSCKLHEWLLKCVRPLFSSVLETMPACATSSLHDIQRYMKKYGYDWECLTDQQHTDLQAALANAADDTQAQDGDDNKSATTKQTSQWKSFEFLETMHFWDATATVPDRCISLLSEHARVVMEEKFGAWLQSAPAIPESIALLEPHEIVKQLMDGTSKLEDIVGQLKNWHSRWEIDMVSRFMDRVRATHCDHVQSNLSLYMGRLSKQHLTSQSSDHQISFSHGQVPREPDVGGAYDGLRYHPKRAVTEPVTETIHQDDPINHQVIDDFHGSTMNEGAEEVVMFVSQLLRRVCVASGLTPFNTHVLQDISKYVYRPSRADALQQYAPDVSKDFIAELLSPKIQVTLDRINDSILSTEVRGMLIKEYPSIHNEWEKACFDASAMALALWWIDLQTQALNGTLYLNLCQGMNACMPLWDPYGYPLESEDKSCRCGILPYLCAITHHMEPSIIDSPFRLQTSAVKWVRDTFPGKIDMLRRKWHDIQSNDRITDPAKIAKLSLIDAISTIKAKKKVDVLPSYIKAMIHLPCILPKSKHTRHACVIKLESIDTDIDWRDHWKDLHTIKHGLSKRRMTVDGVPLKRYSVVSEAVAKQDGQLVKVVSGDSHEGKSSSDRTATSHTWIPPSHIEMMEKRPQEIAGVWAKTLLTQVYGTLRATAMQRMLDNLIQSHTSAVLSWLSEISRIVTENIPCDVRPKVVEGTIAPMRELLRSTKNNSDDAKYIIAYCFVVACVLPFSIQGNGLIDKLHIPGPDAAHITDCIYEHTLFNV